jgi:TonB family protein
VSCLLVTALLGSLGESFGLIQSFSALAYVGPEHRAEMLARAMTIARYPVTFSIVIMSLTAPPAILAAILLATFASSSRERSKALELASALAGAKAAPAPRSTGGLAGAAVFLTLLLITSTVLVLPSGRLIKVQALIDKTWADSSAKFPEKADDSKLAKAVLPPPEEPGAGAPKKKGKKPFEESTADGALPSQVIKKVMMSHMNQIRSCYESKLGKSGMVNSKIVIQFTISPKGSVSSAKVTSSTLHSSGVEECVLKVVKRMKFPKPKGGGSVTLTYPFIFTGT